MHKNLYSRSLSIGGSVILIFSTFLGGNTGVARAQDLATATPDGLVLGKTLASEPSTTPLSTITSETLSSKAESPTPTFEAIQTATPSGSSSTDIQRIQPLATDGSSLYYYANGNRIHLIPSLSWVSVKFLSDDPTLQSTAVQSTGAPVGSLGQARQISNPKLTLLPLQDGLTAQRVIQGINTMRANPADFVQVNPVFQTSDAEMAITNEFIATFPASKTKEEINLINSSHNVELVEPVLGQGNTFVLRVLPASNMDVLSMANLYQESGTAEYSAPNFVRILEGNPAKNQTRAFSGALGATNDYYYPDQWALNNIQQYGSGMTNDADIDAPEAWDHTTGSSSVIIAVIDEGVDLTHEDLIGKFVTGYDATGGGSGGGPSGDDAHGTNVAGLAAAHSNNGIGVAGVCQNCKIMPVRIAYGDGYGGWIAYDSWIANGITWAYQNGASILSNSWGGGTESTVIDTAITNAKGLGRNGKGSVVVFAAGNDNASSVSYPAYLSNVIAVGASNMCDQRKSPTYDLCNGYENFWGSNYGSALDISAPGVWLTSTDIMGAAGYDSGNYYAYMNGTSGATPIVSGVAGLILSLNPSLTADQVQTVLQSTADDVNGGGWDSYMGYGRVNADKAVAMELPATLITPSGSIGMNYNPTYTWNEAGNSTWYLLQVNTNTPNNSIIYEWYTTAQANCNGTTCSVTPATALTGGGSYTWWVETYNAAGSGPWSAPMSFNTGIAGLPSAATLVTPTGNIGTTYNPTYTWNQVNEATDYYLWVDGPSGNMIKQWYTTAQASCNGTTCSVTPGATLVGGAYTWKVQTWNSVGYGPWSSVMSFTTTIPTLPGAASLLTPSGNIGTNYNPIYTWNQVTGSTWYNLWVNGPNGQVILQWYSLAQANCNGTTCAVTPSTTLGVGAYTWEVQTYNSVGNGPWSSSKSFSAAAPTAPGAATLVSPTGGIGMNYNPTYTWNQVSGSTQYNLSVNDRNGNIFNQWYTSVQANCNGTTCSVTPSPTLGGGEAYTWWVQTWNSVGNGPWSSGVNFSTALPTIPGLATLSAPAGSIGMNYNPTYTWNQVAGSTWYYLWVNGQNGNLIKQWITFAQSNCNGTTCSVTPALTLNGGEQYTWWVQTWNSVGSGPWSTGMNFSTSVPTLAGAATLVTPAGNIGTNHSPTYTWNQVTNSTWYYLWVNGPSGTMIKQWYTSTQANCNGTTCSVTLATTLTGGAYTWWVETYNSVGNGPWSAALNFTVSP